VVTRQSKADPIRKTAQSSPIPTGIAALAAPENRPRPAGVSIRRSCAISSFSGSGIGAPYYTARSEFDPEWCGLGNFIAVTCPSDRAGYPIFRNLLQLCTSLTRGTYFVTVDQSFTKDLWPAKFCSQLQLQTNRNLRFWSKFR
jgi:hypothetical protein